MLMFRSETRQSGQSRPEHLEEGVKRPIGWPAADTSEAPSRGPDILKLHI
jgi:hypothetical protein